MPIPASCPYCGHPKVSLHAVENRPERPARERYRCRKEGCRRTWFSHPVTLGLRAGAKLLGEQSVYEHFFEVVARRLLVLGLPRAIRSACAAAGISRDRATRWIGALDARRYNALRPVTGQNHELLRTCLGVFCGRFPVPDRGEPMASIPSASLTPRIATREFLYKRSDVVWALLARARWVAALVAGDLAPTPATQARATRFHSTDWLARSFPSWIDLHIPFQHEAWDHAPVSAWRQVLREVEGIRYFIEQHTPVTWWDSAEARAWLAQWETPLWQQWLRRAAYAPASWESETAGEWLAGDPAPQPAEHYTLTDLVQARIEDWRALSEMDTRDEERGRSYWLVGQHKTLRVVVCSRTRVLGYAAEYFGSSKGLPTRFALPLHPPDRDYHNPGLHAPMRLAIPFRGCKDEEGNLHALHLHYQKVWELPDAQRSSATSSRPSTALHNV